MHQPIDRASTELIDEAVFDLDPRANVARRVIVAFFLIAGLAYLSWRPAAFDSANLVYATAFWFVEIFAFVLWMIRFGLVAADRRPRPKPFAPTASSVDVFVTVFREPVEIIRRSVVAAAQIRYPHKTWVLDDSNRPEIAQLAAEVGCQYLARQRNTHAKAGNINNGLAHATGEFVALFDADHVPQRDFLDRLLGYFHDPDVAIVQTPQDFYNLDSFQHGSKGADQIINEISSFSYVEQIARDRFDMAIFCGSSAVLRRAALDEIGGIPVDTVAEDMHTTIKMHRRGWKSVFHPEPLAFGVAAPDYSDFLRQRLRWATGNMQSARLEGIPFVRSLGLIGNLFYLNSSVVYLYSLVTVCFCCAPIIFLLTGVTPVRAPITEYLSYFIPYLFMTTLASSVCGRGFAPYLTMERHGFARLLVCAGVIRGFFRHRVPFRSSLKVRRGKFPWIQSLPQIVVFVFGIFATIAGIRLIFSDVVSGPMQNIMIALSLLATYNAFVSALVLSEIGRTSRSGASGAHRIAMPVLIGSSNGSVLAATTSISINGARTTATSHFLQHDRAPWTIFLPDGPLTIQAQPIDDSGQWSFIWNSNKDRDRLDQALHAGRWHRPVMGRYERTLTILERLRFVVRPRMYVNIGKRWAPALAYVPDDGTATPHLCYVSPDQADHGTDVAVVFGPVTISDQIEVTFVSDRESRYYEIVGTAQHFVAHAQSFAAWNGRVVFLVRSNSAVSDNDRINRKDVGFCPALDRVVAA